MCLCIYTLLPGRFVATAELVDFRGLGLMTRLMRAIPIERTRLRQLPDVVAAMTEHLRSGRTVVAFPEGTTWCGLAHGPFRPAMFQAAIARRPTCAAATPDVPPQRRHDVDGGRLPR